MDVRLPDGTVIKGVPDDMSKADLTAKLKLNGYDISKLDAQQSTPPAPARGKAGMFDMLSMPFEMGLSLAQKPRKEQVEFIAPTVEALGMAGGSLVGMRGGPLSGIAGAGVGYAAAKELMRHATGTATPETLGTASAHIEHT